MNKYKSVIGLEIHVELSTKSKMFCQCSADYFGKEPNTHTCPVCLGLPGALPVPNKKAIEWTLLIGKALSCSINKISKFDRKHYFYPDLPKGYQISQYDEPFCVNGKLGDIRIRRVHLEEDTGKLLHRENNTLVDFNRSGVPLVEIVTEPDFTNSEEVKRFGEELQAIVRALKVSDVDMEKGSMRLEPNISVKKIGETSLPTYKVEVKNINSFNFAKRAIDYEVQRHSELLEKGETPAQETRGFSESKNITVGQRSKEEAHDYRYFPEPDIPPFEFDDPYLNSIFSLMPILPEDYRKEFVDIYLLNERTAYFLSRNSLTAQRFKTIVQKLLTKKKNIEASLQTETLKSGKKYYQAQVAANLIVNKRVDLDKMTDDEIVEATFKSTLSYGFDKEKYESLLTQVINENVESVSAYKKGKEAALGPLIGQIMKATKGQADPKLIAEALKEKIK